MKTIYTENDIQKFLLQHEILWRGERFEASRFINEIPAIINLFNKAENLEVYLDINYLNFKIYYMDCNICYQDTTYYKKLYKDLSKEWIAYLVNKYPTAYEIIKQQIQKQKKFILENAQKNILPLKKQIDKIKQQAKKEILYWDKFENCLNNLKKHIDKQ